MWRWWYWRLRSPENVICRCWSLQLIFHWVKNVFKYLLLNSAFLYISYLICKTVRYFCHTHCLTGILKLLVINIWWCYFHCTIITNVKVVVMSWAQYLSCVIRWSLFMYLSCVTSWWLFCVPALCHMLVTILCSCLVSSGGRIPDAAMIHAARKRRQMAREMGNDYIAIESNSNMKWVFHVILRKGINHWLGVRTLKLQVLRFS